MMEKLGSIGRFMAIAGVVSGGLSLVGYNLRILMWIDAWGPTAAWAIRGGLVAVGVGLMLAGRSTELEAEPNPEPGTPAE